MSAIKTAWIDVETTGITDKDVILELGIRLGDRDGNPISEFCSLVWEEFYTDKLAEMNDFAREMHKKSGLLADLVQVQPKEIFSNRAVQARALEFLEDANVDHEFAGLPMAGSSVQFDRRMVERYMPVMASWFHPYRNLDISSFKEGCRFLNPSVFSKLPEPEKPHRPLGCITNTVAEYQFYIDNFLWTDAP